MRVCRCVGCAGIMCIGGGVRFSKCVCEGSVAWILSFSVSLC